MFLESKGAKQGNRNWVEKVSRVLIEGVFEMEPRLAQLYLFFHPLLLVVFTKLTCAQAIIMRYNFLTILQ